MGKKRKLSIPSTSASSSPRARLELKDEKQFAGPSRLSAKPPLRMVSETNVSLSFDLPKSEPAEPTYSGDIVNARDRLKGALQDILEQSDDSSSSSTEDTPHADNTARQIIIKKEPVIQATQTLKTIRQQQRRRRRREMLAEGAFHHTFVMKLFDRSVDLAQFKEDTPLYPVCRAWMANQPHNTNLVPKMRTPTPEPPPEEQETPMEGISGGDDIDSVRDTYKMPPPLPLPEDENERKRLRIPSPIPREKEELELDYEVKPPVPKDILLQGHLAHWAAVRKKWHETTRRNAARYEESARILKAIYKKAQKAFA